MKAFRIVAGAIALVLGTLSILVASAATLAVALVVNAVGTTGVVTQSIGTVSSQPGDVAIVLDKVQARIDPPALPGPVDDLLRVVGVSPDQVLDQSGDFFLVATPTESGDIFLGVASPEAVDGYLFGHPFSVAEDAATGWQVRSVPGEGAPGAPGDQGFWAATAQGTPAQLVASSLSGESLVLMHPDSASPVSAALRLEYRAPQARPFLESSALTGAGGGVGGLLLVLLGAWMIVGRRTTGRHS